MHIPNGFLSDPVCAATTATAALACGGSLWRLRRAGAGQGESLALAAGGIFVAQLINFPVDHGTSGHLLGVAAAAILLGPCMATLAMTLVLVTQALLFADGGLTTLGANMLSMGVVAPWTAWGMWRLTAGERNTVGPHRCLAVIGSTTTDMLKIALAGFAAVLAAATVCSLELAAGGAVSLAEGLPAMLQAHLLVAISEGLMTAGVVALCVRAAGVAARHPLRQGDSRGWRVSAYAVAALALLAAPLASTAPDGLERVAEQLGFAGRQTDSLLALAPDYQLPGFEDSAFALIVAGLVGLTVLHISGRLVARLALCPTPRAPFDRAPTMH